VANGLDAMGVTVEPTADGMGITGGRGLRGAALASHGDHRLAMAWAVAGLVARGETRVGGAEVADVSYPGFWQTLQQVSAEF
jgi:3-phosphoshikimate 1-carboxyvinyltransferase